MEYALCMCKMFYLMNSVCYSSCFLQILTDFARIPRIVQGNTLKLIEKHTSVDKEKKFHGRGGSPPQGPWNFFISGSTCIKFNKQSKYKY